MFNYSIDSNGKDTAFFCARRSVRTENGPRKIIILPVGDINKLKLYAKTGVSFQLLSQQFDEKTRLFESAEDPSEKQHLAEELMDIINEFFEFLPFSIDFSLNIFTAYGGMHPNKILIDIEPEKEYDFFKSQPCTINLSLSGEAAETAGNLNTQRGKGPAGIIPVLPENTETERPAWYQKYQCRYKFTHYVKSKIFGIPYALLTVIRILNLEEIMDECYGVKYINGIKRSVILISDIIIRAMKPGSMSSFIDRSIDTCLGDMLNIDLTKLKYRVIWEAMDGLTTVHFEKLYNMVIQRLMEVFDFEITTLHLDYTNYYTFLSSLNEAACLCRRGHSKEKRYDLKIFGLGVVVTPFMNIPLLYNVYPGNTNDTTEFPQMLNMVCNFPDLFGIPGKDVTLCFDGGSVSADNFKLIKIPFMCSYSLTNRKDLADIPVEKYMTAANPAGKVKKYMEITGLNCSGTDGKGFLTYSDDLFAGQLSQYTKERDKIIIALDKIASSPVRIANVINEYSDRAHEYVHNTMHPGKKAAKEDQDPAVWDSGKVLEEIINNKAAKLAGGTFQFPVNYIKYEFNISENHFTFTYSTDEKRFTEYAHNKFGKKLIFTNKMDMTGEEAILNSSNQEHAEHFFRISKDTGHFGFRPVYHYTDQKIEAHTSQCIISVLVVLTLLKYLEQNGVKLSAPRLLDILTNIREGHANFNRVYEYTYLDEISDLQEKILSLVCAFGQKMPAKRKYAA